VKELDKLNPTYIQDLYLKIGKNVKKIREQKGVSQLSLSHAIGHSSATMISCCEICYKNYHFNIEHLAKIAYVLEVDIKDFFE
jgi:DNA-binding XRE family transcriptional regulator